jgi:hypothetical protein
VNKNTKGPKEWVKRAAEDAFGLPPDKSPHDNDGPPRDPNAPGGSLSSDETEELQVWSQRSPEVAQEAPQTGRNTRLVPCANPVDTSLGAALFERVTETLGGARRV